MLEAFEYKSRRNYRLGSPVAYNIYQSGETGSGKDPFEEIKKITKAKQPSLTAGSALAVEAMSAPTGPTTIALLFPGQGSQYVKMLEGLKDDANVKQMIATAQSVLGYDILEVCLNGPEEKLEETSVCQPAMFLAGMAGLEKLKKSRPEAVERPGAVAGLSLGEYTALCAAGVFSFEEGAERCG
ncbi:MCAT [Symbiodinium natans]|uniref:MCAT protein n=1 Tax=Symbiodinium natans TaxID=878477 RepID=A0A812RT98_9DINO|nr:MCAT [Symbiodinium natans]